MRRSHICIQKCEAMLDSSVRSGSRFRVSANETGGSESIKKLRHKIECHKQYRHTGKRNKSVAYTAPVFSEKNTTHTHNQDVRRGKSASRIEIDEPPMELSGQYGH